MKTSNYYRSVAALCLSAFLPLAVYATGAEYTTVYKALPGSQLDLLGAHMNLEAQSAEGRAIVEGGPTPEEMGRMDNFPASGSITPEDSVATFNDALTKALNTGTPLTLSTTRGAQLDIIWLGGSLKLDASPGTRFTLIPSPAAATPPAIQLQSGSVLAIPVDPSALPVPRFEQRDMTAPIAPQRPAPFLITLPTLGVGVALTGMAEVNANDGIVNSLVTGVTAQPISLFPLNVGYQLAQASAEGGRQIRPGDSVRILNRFQNPSDPAVDPSVSGQTPFPEIGLVTAPVDNPITAKALRDNRTAENRDDGSADPGDWSLDKLRQEAKESAEDVQIFTDLLYRGHGPDVDQERQRLQDASRRLAVYEFLLSERLKSATPAENRGDQSADPGDWSLDKLRQEAKESAEDVQFFTSRSYRGHGSDPDQERQRLQDASRRLAVYEFLLSRRLKSATPAELREYRDRMKSEVILLGFRGMTGLGSSFDELDNRVTEVDRLLKEREAGNGAGTGAGIGAAASTGNAANAANAAATNTGATNTGNTTTGNTNTGNTNTGNTNTGNTNTGNTNTGTTTAGGVNSGQTPNSGTINNAPAMTGAAGTTGTTPSTPAALTPGSSTAFMNISPEVVGFLMAYQAENEVTVSSIEFKQKGAVLPNCPGSVCLQNGVTAEGATIEGVSITRITGGTGRYFGLPWNPGGVNAGTHIVFGTPTPIAQIPTTGTFTYNFVATTLPTYSNGSTAPGTLTGSAAVNFATLQAGVSMTATMPNQVFTIQTPGGSANPQGLAVQTFLGQRIHFGLGNFTTGTTMCTAASGGCFTSIGGSFFGLNGTFTSVLFKSELGGGVSLNGAALGKR